jgi:uncharacterized membrane protein YgaE (UPF0421/DUF939 family)
MNEDQIKASNDFDAIENAVDRLRQRFSGFVPELKNPQVRDILDKMDSADRRVMTRYLDRWRRHSNQIRRIAADRLEKLKDYDHEAGVSLKLAKEDADDLRRDLEIYKNANTRLNDDADKMHETIRDQKSMLEALEREKMHYIRLWREAGSKLDKVRGAIGGR